MPTLTGAFPVVANNFAAGANLYDYPGVGGEALTAGATNIIRLQGRETVQRPWIITAWSIQGRIAFAVTGGKVGGALGRVYASLMFGTAVTMTPTPWSAASAFTLPPREALPNIVKLWDGSTDGPPPVIAATNNTPLPGRGYFAAAQQLPIPETLSPSDPITIGVWITPGLFFDGGNALVVGDFQYSVTYDPAGARR